MDTIALIIIIDNLREQVPLAKTRPPYTRFFWKSLSHEIELQHLCISEDGLSRSRSHWFTTNYKPYFHHGSQYYADICMLSSSWQPHCCQRLLPQ